MNKIKQLSFEGKVIYCGIDVHKTNWKINARMEGIEMAAFSQNPDPLLLKNYVDKNYPGAELKVVYEAGFCGFEIQRSLKSLGIEVYRCLEHLQDSLLYTNQGGGLCLNIPQPGIVIQ